MWEAYIATRALPDEWLIDCSSNFYRRCKRKKIRVGRARFRSIGHHQLILTVRPRECRSATLLLKLLPQHMKEDEMGCSTSPQVLISLAILFVASQSLCAETPDHPQLDSKTESPVDAGIAEPYARLILNIVDDVGRGSIDEALASMAKHTRDFNEAERQKIRRLFSVIYGGAGEYDGHELVAVRPITKRVHAAFVVGYHEKSAVVYKFTMYEFRGTWRIINFGLDDDLDELEILATIELIGR